MIVHETATHQMTVKFKLLHVPYDPQQRTRVHTITEAVKGPEMQNVKQCIKKTKIDLISMQKC